MPELPEVTTTVRGLQKVLPGLVISSVWTDLAKDKVSRKDFNDTIKSKKFFTNFKKRVTGQKVLKVERRAKNILIYLQNDLIILIHMKMTGNLLFNVKNPKFVHLEFILTSPTATLTPPLTPPQSTGEGKNKIHTLAFSDMRKFGKVTLIDKEKMHASVHLKHLGYEPLDKTFTFDKFKSVLEKKTVKTKNSKIKQSKIKSVLLDQTVIVGIGNIYSDEMLWLSSIHPESNFENIPPKLKEKLYESMREVLKKGINFGGDSMSDYLNINGEKGNFQHHHNAYRKTGTKCGKKGCLGVIIRKVVGGRSAHFCSLHQKFY